MKGCPDCEKRRETFINEAQVVQMRKVMEATPPKDYHEEEEIKEPKDGWGYGILLGSIWLAAFGVFIYSLI